MDVRISIRVEIWNRRCCVWIDDRQTRRRRRHWRRERKVGSIFSFCFSFGVLAAFSDAGGFTSSIEDADGFQILV